MRVQPQQGCKSYIFNASTHKFKTPPAQLGTSFTYYLTADSLVLSAFSKKYLASPSLLKRLHGHLRTPQHSMHNPSEAL